MSQLQLQSRVVFFQAPPLIMVEMVESPQIMDGAPILEAVGESQIKAEFKQRVMELLAKVGPVYAQTKTASVKGKKLELIYCMLNGLLNHLDGVWVGSMEFEIMHHTLAEVEADFAEVVA